MEGLKGIFSSVIPLAVQPYYRDTLISMYVIVDQGIFIACQYYPPHSLRLALSHQILVHEALTTPLTLRQ